MHLKICSQNAEIKLSKEQTHNFNTSFQKNQQNWRWNKAVFRRQFIFFPSIQEVFFFIFTAKPYLINRIHNTLLACIY